MSRQESVKPSRRRSPSAFRARRQSSLLSARDMQPATLGRPVKSISLDGFTLIESVYAPLQRLPAHAHCDATLSLVRRGTLVEVLRKQSQQCRPFDLIVEPPGESHTDQFGPVGATCIHIVINSKRLDALQDFPNVFERPVHARGKLLPVLAAKLNLEMSLRDSASLLAIESLVFEVLAQTKRFASENSGDGPPRWLKQARDLIHGNLNRRLSLREIGDCVGVHPGHLARGFRNYYRCSVGGYLRKVRVETALQLIVQARTSLVEIATSVGFYDQSHFTNAFRLHTGMTPAEFRTQVRADRNCKSAKSASK
jgi:AraC family transcriptional regulator